MSAGTRIRAIVIATGCSLVAVLAVALPSQQLTAQAADLRGFEAGNIISDAVFYDSGRMNAAAVQSFLVAKGSSCAAAAGNTCLKNFRQSTSTRPADSYCSRTYSGAANETAAQIIAKVAGACGINPQVLLVMLQKEQGLVTLTAGGNAGRYRSAMGFGCPDTAACNAKYYGFFNQVYSAAHQFRYYAKNPMSYAHIAGQVNQVRYHPNAACGSSAVYIRNQATASLYNYTPYQPNAAALAAGYGSGNSCSSYGNRNFYSYFRDWFGPTTQRAPIGRLDAASSPSAGVVSVRGWALDPDTTASINVHVYVDGHVVRSLAATLPRPDIGAAYGKGDNHGFSGTVNASNGTHQVCVYAIDSTGGANPRIGCKNVTVTNQQPTGRIDGLTTGMENFALRGWALDPDTTGPIAVHVYVDGKAVQALMANTPRPDIARAFGNGEDHGFQATIAATYGPHTVCVYGIDSWGGPNPRMACSTIDVNGTAFGHLDSAVATPGKITVRGWAIDPNTTGPIFVHVYPSGTPAHAFTANISRPDVGAAYGKGNNHGFSGTVDATRGTNKVCVYAIDSWQGTNPQIKCVSVTVP